MKPKQLKKLENYKAEFYGYSKEDILSAIMWLKKELEKGAESSEEFDYIWVDKMINEAFFDLTKHN